MYEARSREEILAELQKWVDDDLAQIEGSFVYDVLSSNSLEFAKVEKELAECYRQNFAHTNSGEYLQMRAEEKGITRKAANYAIGEVEVQGVGSISKGAYFATVGGLNFIAQSDTELNGTAIIPVVAENVGAAYNVAANTIIKIPMSIPGVRAVTNPAKTYDGFDEEDDETLRERFLFEVRFPAASGNPYQYISWSLSVVGVGAARCQRAYNGPGSVKVVIVDSNFEPANDLLIKRVYDYIFDQQPVGVTDLAVVSAKPIPINITAQVVGNVDIDTFKKSLQIYFTSLVKDATNNYSAVTIGNSGYVSTAQIGKYILTSGARDYRYDTLKLNDSTADIALDIEEIPILGEVIFE